jgi:DNA-binding beta-propeller fold protein YncE
LTCGFYYLPLKHGCTALLPHNQSMKYRLPFLFFFLFLFAFQTGCRHDKGNPDYRGYPEDVGKIVMTNCATSGCHTDQSKGAAGGLSLESWDRLFEGGNGSACIIPYRYDYSTFFSYINTYPDLGVTLIPTMPYSRPALKREEAILLKKWIQSGAPDKNGMVKFADNPNRKKFYLTNQGCDVVTVFDQQTLLPMRYINIGSSPNAESPHMVRVSPDGQYWYVIFLSGNYFEKYRTADDSFVGRALIGPGNWNTFVISSDSKKAYCIDLSPSNAKISTVNLTNLQVSTVMGFVYPHGSALNGTNDVLYVTQQTNSSKLYKIPVNDFTAYSEIDLYTVPPSKELNSHDLRFTPDGSKYFVTCQGTSEVRAFSSSSDSLLAVIPVGAMPSELSFSTSTDHLFVTCMEDTLTFPGKRGSIAVINYKTNTLEKFIYTGHQPHGIEVDDERRLVYVGNRNADKTGPAPHHSNECVGRNGNVSFIDLNTLNMVPSGSSIKKVEVAVDPYSIAIRH